MNFSVSQANVQGVQGHHSEWQVQVRLKEPYMCHGGGDDGDGGGGDGTEDEGGEQEKVRDCLRHHEVNVAR